MKHGMPSSEGPEFEGTTRSPRITVIGSLNMDLVTVTEQVPNGGETVTGSSFSTLFGGKGANQAVACARLGAQVHMVGCVGDDSFGRDMLANLEQQAIHCEHVLVKEHTSSGIAAITIADGDNRIIVVPGANGEVTPEVVRAQEQLIAQSDLVLLQLEIPLAAVKEAAKLAAKHQVPVMLNPAPAYKLDAELLQQITWLTPNEHELFLMFGESDIETSKDEPSTLTSELLQRMPERIVMTKGGDGALWCAMDETIQHAQGYKVQVADTTGAGDTFNGALAVALAEGRTLKQAVHWAVAAGAMSVTKFGAQGGMPKRVELEAFLSSQG